MPATSACDEAFFCLRYAFAIGVVLDIGLNAANASSFWVSEAECESGASRPPSAVAPEFCCRPASSNSHNAPRSSATFMRLWHFGHFPFWPAASVGSFRMFAHCGHRSRATPGSSSMGGTSRNTVAANSRHVGNRSAGFLASPL